MDLIESGDAEHEETRRTLAAETARADAAAAAAARDRAEADRQKTLATSAAAGRRRAEAALAAERRALAAEKARAAAAAKEATLSAGRSMVSPLRQLHHYSTTRLEELEAGPVYQLLSDQFLRTRATHKRHFQERHDALGRAGGFLQGARPLLEITKINRLHNPRLQEKYVTEVQDIAGLVGQQIVDGLPEVNALRVESLPGLNLNEFLLFRGDKSHMAQQLQLSGFDPRLAGTGTAKMFGLGTYFACKSSKADIYTEPNDAGSVAFTSSAPAWGSHTRPRRGMIR